MDAQINPAEGGGERLRLPESQGAVIVKMTSPREAVLLLPPVRSWHAERRRDVSLSGSGYPTPTPSTKLVVIDVLEQQVEAVSCQDEGVVVDRTRGITIGRSR